MKRDKKLHLIVGAIIAPLVGLVMIKFTSLHIFVAIGAGVLAAVAVGWGKEYVHDKSRPGKNTVDEKDFYITALGGVVGAAALSVVLLFLRG